MAREHGKNGSPSPCTLPDFREILTYWRSRADRLAPGFVTRVFQSAGEDCSECDLSQILPAGDGADVSPTLSPSPFPPHRVSLVSPRTKMAVLWWSVTLMFLMALMLLLLSDWFEPQLYAESCDCQSIYDIMGWESEEL